MRVARDAVDVAAAGKRLVGLVHDHQAALCALGQHDLLDRVVVPQVTRGVVGVSQIHDGRLVLINRGQHGGFVKFKVWGKGYAMEIQALQLGAHGVHHKAGQRGQDGSAGHITGHGQKRDQLVRAVAQHDVKAFGHACVTCQRLAKLVHTLAGVAIERQRAQTLAQSLLQIRRQAVRVFHRVELDHARRILDGIGVHGLHVLADALHQLGAHGGRGAHWGALIGGTGFKRNSAARAWACKPSP